MRNMDELKNLIYGDDESSPGIIFDTIEEANLKLAPHNVKMSQFQPDDWNSFNFHTNGAFMGTVQYISQPSDPSPDVYIFTINPITTL